MSHVDDPTKTPDQAQTITLPDLTKREIVEELEKATGKTAGELFLLEEQQLNEIVEETFNKEKYDQAGKKADGRTADGGAASADPKPKDGAATEDAEVTVSIKPSLLGPTNGKDLKIALAEVIERGRAAESTAELFKSQTIPRMETEIRTREERLGAVTNENAELRRQLEELRSKPPSAPAPAKTDGQDTAVEQLPEIPDIPKEFDPFDPEQRAKMADAINALKKRDEIFQKRLAEKPKEPPKQEPPPPPPPRQEQPAKTSDQARIDEELNAVRSLQSHPQISGFLKTTRDIREINNDYVSFGEKLARLCGIQKATDEKGLFTQQALNVISLYYDQENPEGNNVRSAARMNKIEPPDSEDMAALKRVSIIRSYQNSRFTRDRSGNVVPIPAEEAFALAQRENPALFTAKDPVTARKQELDAEQRALANRQGHSTEVPPAVGADVASGKPIIPEAQMLRLIQKGNDRTADEQVLLAAELKRQGLGEDEIKMFIEPTVAKP